MKALYHPMLLTILFCMTASASFSNTCQSTDAAMIDYETTGTGTPFVLLHSSMMSQEDMRAQIECFSNFYQVIAIDAREQGRSSSSNTPISYAIMAADVIGNLDDLDIEKTNFLGQEAFGPAKRGGIHDLGQCHFQ